MQDAGYKTIEIAKKNGSWLILDDVEALLMPEDLKKEFSKREGALEYYESLSNSAKKIYWHGLLLLKDLILNKKELLK